MASATGSSPISEVLLMEYATIDRLSDVELVALVLGRQVKDEVCMRLATVLATDGWMGTAPLAEIARECEKVGPRSVARLEAAVELGRRALAARAARTVQTVSTPEDAVALVKPLLVGQEREYFYAICLDTKNRVKKVVQVSIGSLNASIVHPRELFREAIAVSAAAVVVCHVHPSGDPAPSGADVQLTRRLVRAGDVIGIDVLDHVVVGGDQFASLRELGLM